MEDDLNLLEYWRVITRRKKAIAIFVSVVTLIAIIYALLATKIYRAHAVILPIGGGNTSALSALIPKAGLGALLLGGQDSSSSSLMAVLNSRTLAERVIEKMHLLPVFFEKNWDSKDKKWISGKAPSMELALIKLKGMIEIDEDPKSGLINLAAETENPKLSARVVNGYLKELSTYLSENELTSAKRNRLFIEDQLAQNNIQLLRTGKELSQFYGNNQISNLDPRIDVNVAIDKIISSDKFAEINKKVTELKEKGIDLKEKIKKSRLVRAVPQQVYLEYLTGYYQLLGQMNALLTQQYEMAKIDEAKEDISFQIIDKARVPERRYKPRRKLIVSLAFTASLLMAFFAAFFADYWRKLHENDKRKL